MHIAIHYISSLVLLQFLLWISLLQSGVHGETIKIKVVTMNNLQLWDTQLYFYHP